MRHLCKRELHHDKGYEALEELFRCCEVFDLDAEVNNKDINGDTALHMAMVGSCPKLVKLLLEKGAEVLGSGYADATVLIKPFMVVSTVNGDSRTSDEKDEDISKCVKEVLEAVLQRA
jgi:hypothetical protein